MRTPERFTAVAMCPRCKSVAVHKMREPKPFDAAAYADWKRDHQTTEISMFGTLATRVVKCPPEPIDESQYEVIRQCECGQEWGQA